jgi:hypothetical protein
MPKPSLQRKLFSDKIKSQQHRFCLIIPSNKKMLHKIIFIIPTFIFLLPLLAQMIRPIQSSSVPNVAKEKEPLKALKMIGPEPLAPGQKGTIKTAYFDPKVSARKGKEIEEGMPQGHCQ